MSADAEIAQALFLVAGGSIKEVGKSANFAADWSVEAERLCRGFGSPRPGVACPAALFAQPFGPRHVAVVQVADQQAGLGFRFRVLSRDLYTHSIGDPFLVGDRFLPDWSASGELRALQWPVDAAPRRTIAQLQQVLETGGSQTLLGGVQALVDGGRLYFERVAPAPQLIRDLWALLPNSSRAELWPATFAYSNDLGFDVLVLPMRPIPGGPAPAGTDRYVTEEQVVDYPEGRYEFSLQYAVEHDQQRELDRLLNRPTGMRRFWLALFILIGGALTYLAILAIGRFL